VSVARSGDPVISVAFLQALFRHMEWADAAVWTAVPVAEAPDDRLRELLVHLHTVQRAFLNIWTARPVQDGLRAPTDFVTLSDVRAWARPYYADAGAFVATLTDERLYGQVSLPWAARLVERFGRMPEFTTLGDTCFQVASHSTYHRGQVNARLRQLGAEPPLVDYIAWIWLGRPVPAWQA
jgi:uncharacterized damage-inducible protein DinB